MSHSPALPTDVLYRFGEFVADPVIGRLHYRFDEVRITRKTFELLVALLEHDGRIVEKDQLFQLIWPDTIVEDNNLARCVSMLRKALRDYDPNSEFLTTFPGRGYAFSLPVERVRRADLALAGQVDGAQEQLPAMAPRTDAGDDPDAAPEHIAPLAVPNAARAPRRHARIRWPYVLATVGIVAAISIVAVAWRPSSSRVPPDGETRLWQLTSASGLEVEPSWSPDGRFIAYSSNRSGNFDIWIQPVLGGNPIQITHADVAESQPAWSPDGRYLAFRSEQDGGGLFLVPAFGGAARRLTSFGQFPMWSPDGSHLLFYLARRPLENRAFVVSLNGQPPREVLADVLGRLSSFRVAWHPDGRRISVFGWDADRQWRFLTAAPDGRETIESAISLAVRDRVKSLGLQLGRFRWTPDGRSLLFEGRAQQAQNVYRVSVNPTSLEWVDGPLSLTTATNALTDIAISADGRRVAFSSRVARTRAWSFPLDLEHRRVSGPGEPVTPDGSDATNLDISGDGRRLAYWKAHNGRQELWVRSVDEKAEALTAVEDAGAQLRWSPDGTQVAYARRAGSREQQPAVVLASSTGQRDQVVSSRGPIAVLDWLSPESMLVNCPAGPTIAICSMQLTTGSASRLTVVASDPGRSLFQGRVSPDHRWISFIARTDASSSTVYVMPAAGGAWIPISDDGHVYADKPRWSADASTVYFLSDRSGGLNVWGRRLDRRTGQPLGPSFDVTEFQTPDRVIPEQMGPLQMAVTKERLILPVTNVSGSVWVLESVDR